MSETVLIVDDDPAVLRLLRHQLERAGYHVVTAEDGRSALRQLDAARPAIVLTDWHMPGMSGLEVCRHLRRCDGFDGIYTIILTADGDADRLVEALESGADDYVTKPCDPRELLARLRAGERIVNLERKLARRNKEVQRSKAILESAYEKLEQANERLEQMARTDELTGLGNRRSAMGALTSLWEDSARHGEPLAVLLLDIDCFKLVNDTHGHAAGDRVLVVVSDVIGRNARWGESVYRLGGEEFLVVCPASTADMAAAAAERIREAVARTMVRIDEGDPLRVTISGGEAERTDAMEDHDALVRAADDALYAAKRGGRNCVRIAGAEPVTKTA